MSEKPVQRRYTVHRRATHRVDTIHDVICSPGVAIPYTGPYDDDGVPLTPYCQAIKEYVRAHPEVNGDVEHAAMLRELRQEAAGKCIDCAADLPERSRALRCQRCRNERINDLKRESDARRPRRKERVA